MIRVDEETNLGVAVSTDCNGRFAKLDPYAGAQLALAESYRNVATGGARPLAITDCLNFGSPEDPDVMWQFAEACRGLKDACVELGIPVTGGNVSLYNQTGETAILPTPVVAVLGVIDDVTRRTPSGFVADGRARSSCSARPARSCPARSGRTSCTATSAGCRRAVDLAAERALAELLVEAVGTGHQRPRPLRRRAGAGAGRGRLRDGVGATVALAGDPFVGAVRRVGCPGDRDRARGRRRPAGRAGRPARRTRSPRSAAPVAIAEVEGEFAVRSTSCAGLDGHPARACLA